MFISNTDKPDVFTSPTTFNVDLLVVEFNDVKPETCKLEINVDGLLKLITAGGVNIAL